MEVYTARRLTLPSDKLVACSILTKTMTEIVQDDYVAGMWHRPLEGEILWMIEGDHRPGSRPDRVSIVLRLGLGLQ